MTPTPVGMRCPECARERTKVRTLSSGTGRVQAWEVLIGLNVIVFLAEVASGVTLGGSDSGWVYSHGVLFGPALTSNNPYTHFFPGTDEFWRMLTAGFMHASLIHIGLNMLSLWFVGRVLEPAIGTLNFVAIYFASLLAGSFCSLLFSPDIPTLGASTAIFGIFGALIVVARARGIPIWQSGLGPLLAINVLFTLTNSDISVGGHVGGLVGGLICGWFVTELGERRNNRTAALLGCLAVAVISVIGGIAVAGGTGIAPNGISI
jgi:membrane associated rhomboid family serine protease